MKYLVRVIETYRVESEAEAKQTIEEAKKDGSFTLTKYASEYKCTKAKKEIEDEWYRVTLTKDFNAEKEPEYFVDVKYHTEPAFPEPMVKETTDDEDEDDKNGGLEF